MKVLADEAKVHDLTRQLAQAIAEDLHLAAWPRPWALVGIRSRGDVLAKRLVSLLNPPLVGTLDITLYRDDLSEIASQPIVRPTEIPFSVDGLDVVLVDDVLMTGRSVRAAMQSLMDMGRPKRIWLSVLVDRGGRELPIAADQVALDLTGRSERSMAALVDLQHRVDVHLTPMDTQDEIVLRPLAIQEN